jgi:hypothetical protein
MDAYADLAASLLHVFALWHTWQPSEAVRERELCRALHGSRRRFDEYCESLLLSVLEAGIADTAAESARAQARQPWARMQLAISFELRRSSYNARRDEVRRRWNRRLRSARRAKQRGEDAITALESQKKQALDAVAVPLEGLPPPVPDARDKAAVRQRRLAKDKLDHERRPYRAGHPPAAVLLALRWRGWTRACCWGGCRPPRSFVLPL